jgi:small subunit ribosomal protein S17
MRKGRVGRVVSNKMEKTVVVEVEWRKVHPLYGKAVRRLKRFKAHDETNACRVGDVVRIVETRPLSREKRWRVVETLVANTGPGALPSFEEELVALSAEAPPASEGALGTAAEATPPPQEAP